VIWRDDGVELATHRAHEHSVGGKGPTDSRLARRGGEDLFILAAESAVVAAMGVECAERDFWIRNAEPILKTIARDLRRGDDRVARHGGGHFTQRQMGGGQDNAELVGREHHCDARSGESGEHLGMSGIIEAAGEQRPLVYGSGDDARNRSFFCEIHSALDCETAKSARELRVAAGFPFTDNLRDIEAGIGRTDYQNVTALANPWVGERLGDYLGPDAAGIARGYGEQRPRRHRYKRTETKVSFRRLSSSWRIARSSASCARICSRISLTSY